MYPSQRSVVTHLRLALLLLLRRCLDVYNFRIFHHALWSRTSASPSSFLPALRARSRACRIGRSAIPGPRAWA